jgi:nicotinamide riboside kinase
MGRLIAILGAESTGKTTLTEQLAEALRTHDHSVAVVSEYLREFCDARGRTPFAHEQQAIADTQTQRIAAASQTHDVVIADTTALMIAVYSDHLFGDASLYASALDATRRCNLVLLTSLDLPWAADGLQRDGPHVRQPVDAKVRSALAGAGIGYSVVSSRGQERVACALAATNHVMNAPDLDATGPRWQWTCDRCGDVDCERHLLPRG